MKNVINLELKLQKNEKIYNYEPFELLYSEETSFKLF